MDLLVAAILHFELVLVIQCYSQRFYFCTKKDAINEQFFNRTQNDAIWGLIALFLTNQNAGNTIDFKMNVINYKIRLDIMPDNLETITVEITKPKAKPFL